MIYIDLKGNLGNQLFEYALARTIQEETQQGIVINTYFLKKYKPEYTCSLQHYILNDNVYFENEKSLGLQYNTYFWANRILKKLFPNWFYQLNARHGCFVWLHESYKELAIFPEKKDYHLIGYWQSTKYFDKIDDILRKEFTPKEPLNPINQELYDIITDTESICVTIRRGDYVTNAKYRKMFFQCDTDYFLKGIEKIREEIPGATVICFSDDIDWVKKNVPITGNVYYESGNDPVYEKLRLMSACKHFVISNSSFSWWAQHLSTNPDKIVYAPSKWYPDGRKCDIYEDGWRYLSCERLK